MRLRKCDQLKTVLAMYEQEVNPNLSKPPNYQELKFMVMRCMDQEIRARNFEATNDRIGTGKLEKGNVSLLKGNTENVVSGKQNDSAQR